MYKIGELSRLCQLPVKTLRYYDSIGLLVPDEVDGFTGYRYYSAAKIADCNRIIALKELGFSLDEIRAYLHSESAKHLIALLDAKLAELRTSLAKGETQLKQLEAIRERMEEEHKKPFDLVIKKADAITVAFTRAVFPRKEDVFEEIASMKQALPARLAGRTVVVNYECEYREDNFDLAACVEITGALPENAAYTQRTLTFSSDVATVICKKEELDAAYRSMGVQLDDALVQIAGAYYEIYYEDGTVELRVPVWKIPAPDALEDDDRNLPFINDEEVIGKWKLLDILPSEEQFLYGHAKSSHESWLGELYFLENGGPYWVYEGWTKGVLFTWDNGHHFNSLYTTRQIDGHRLLFLHRKGRKGLPQVWVYEKVSDEIFRDSDIRRRDFVDYPFVADEAVLGHWKLKDFVESPDAFDPKRQSWAIESLDLRKAVFLPGGDCQLVMTRVQISLRWTKGYLLDRRWETASAYQIRKIDGVEYLMFEWKSGDYIYGRDSRIYWYVLTRT